MRFLKRSKFNKLIIVLSDLHLSAGFFVNGRKNFLENFHFDEELVEFLKYYSNKKYRKKDIHLILNGDFLDFLAVPFVDYFDDEYWSEEASLQKLKLILKAHQEVIEALKKFLEAPRKKITYILGNHDAQMIFPSLREHFLAQFPSEIVDRFDINLQEDDFRPENFISVKHGHEYELAHNYSLKNSIIKTVDGQSYFVPPWGAYYVTRVINRYKEERSFIDSIRPIRTFLIYGMIFDTLFTTRFILANIYYFFMVIFLSHLKQRKTLNVKEIINNILRELKLLKDYQIKDEFLKHPKLKVCIVSHTHIPSLQTDVDGTIIINTGSWVKMHNLDFTNKQDGKKLTYAVVEIQKVRKGIIKDFSSNLFVWKGENKLPYDDF